MRSQRITLGNGHLAMQVAPLDEPVPKLITQATERFRLSARGFRRVLRPYSGRRVLPGR